jgi:hypothetical protein
MHEENGRSGGENFGQRMVRLKRERGLPQSENAGRKPIAEKYRAQVEAVERTFAGALPALTETYIAELWTKEPETCPTHHKLLRCPAKGCATVSRRTEFDHKAAAYAFDRILGRPTSRSENSLTVRFLSEITASIVAIFADVNELEDARARREEFARRLRLVGDAYQAGGW